MPNMDYGSLTQTFNMPAFKR